MILGVVLPIIHVNIWKARDQKLQLLLVEDRNQLCRYNIMEA
jgi:hypothetical protein